MPSDPGSMTWVLFSLALFAFLAALILTPLIRDLAQRFGFVDVPDQHRNPILCVGGVAIFLSYSSAFAATLFSFKNVTILFVARRVMLSPVIILGPTSLAGKPFWVQCDCNGTLQERN